MGKTGTTLWAQVKGVKGQIRLVPKQEGEAKTPGPNQRFKAGAKVQQLDQIAEAQGGRPGGRRGGARRGGDRSGGSGMNESTANPMIRRHMKRAKVSALGAKAKSSR